jgi:4,5-dihydroxyphthalate decarboxylase
MLRHREFDVAEMSLSSYTVSMFREPRRSSPSQSFRRGSFATTAFYINASAGSANRRT